MGKLLPIYCKLYLLLLILNRGILVDSLQNLLTVHRLLLCPLRFSSRNEKEFYGLILIPINLSSLACSAERDDATRMLFLT